MEQTYELPLKEGGTLLCKISEIRGIKPNLKDTIIILKDGTKWEVKGKYKIYVDSCSEISLITDN